MENPPFRKHERRAVNTASSGLQVRRILVPIDFRDTTVVALQYAAAFARQYKATITLLHIVEPDGSAGSRISKSSMKPRRRMPT